MKRTVLVDFAAADRSREPEGPMKVVHPIDAIQFIATGQFYSQPVNPVRDWYMCAEGEDDWLLERVSGRIDLAAEILTHAIEAGRLRCVFVVKTNNSRRPGEPDCMRLEVIAPDQLEGAEVTHSWDDGFSLCVVRKDESASESEHVEWVENFLLFWDEVARISPHRLDESTEAEYAPPPPRPVTYQHAFGEGRGLTSPSRNLGRPTKAPAAHAALALKLASESDADLAAYKVETAAVELQALLKDRGAAGEPHIDNCTKAARLILREVKSHKGITA